MDVRVKICGITNAADARAATRAGADMLGFIQYEKSPRYLAPDQVRDIIQGLRASLERAPEMVGVFVNAPVATVVEVARHCRFDTVQLHGDESPEAAHALREAGWQVFKAFAIADARSVERFADYEVDGYLCDTPSPDLWGGTGQAFDHTLLAGAAEGRLILAGGLHPDNVARAIRLVRPWAVDVSSGVEAAPGVKDHERIGRFMNAVAQAGL